MDEFLAKPVQAADLWTAMDQVMRREEGKTQNAPAPSFFRPPSSLLDPQVLLAACGGDAAILEKICRVFRARLPDQLQAVREALQDRDAPRLREAAHKLAGMAAAFSTVTGGVASELEDLAEQGRLEEAGPLASRLEPMAKELTRLVGELSLDALRTQAKTAVEPGGPAGR
jgi:HPt (histidine-containing phosphotransfer) domain-containing protein